MFLYKNNTSPENKLNKQVHNYMTQGQQMHEFYIESWRTNLRQLIFNKVSRSIFSQ